MYAQNIVQKVFDPRLDLNQRLPVLAQHATQVINLSFLYKRITQYNLVSNHINDSFSI